MHIIHRADAAVQSTSVIVRWHDATIMEMMEFVTVSAAAPSPLKAYRYVAMSSLCIICIGVIAVHIHIDEKEEKSLNGMCLWLYEQCWMYTVDFYCNRNMATEWLGESTKLFYWERLCASLDYLDFQWGSIRWSLRSQCTQCIAYTLCDQLVAPLRKRFCWFAF